MSINAISAASSYYSFSSINNEDELIKKKLLALGLVPTGNANLDKNLLLRAEKSQKGEDTQSILGQQTQSTQQQSGGAAPGVPEVWMQLMAQLGLISSGDVEVDYIKATAEVKQRIIHAQDERSKTKYESIQEKMDEFVANYKKESPSAMVGATMVGEMNKLSIVRQ